ncbi:hypothetical protein IJJ18_02200 [Candidatus Saccharibacteria bacterium]|nr:hypothetical protein [Candidatus Saccharibacteria bacterium]
MKKRSSVFADATLNVTGLNNLRAGSVREANADELGPDELVSVDEMEDEFVDVGDTESEESVSTDSAEDSKADDTADKIADEVVAEVQAETAESVQNLEKGNSQPVKKQEEKGGGTMRKYPISFYDNIRDQAYAAVNDGKLSEELEGFVMDIIRSYPKVRAQAADWIDAYEAENTVPDYGWRYKAKGILDGATFDSKDEAEKEAKDFIGLGHTFEELFVATPFYKNADGGFGEPIPEDSRHWELIMDQIELASGQQSASVD